jgi:Domain of unknown function (DUF222)
LAALINPDGDYRDGDRARRRYVRVGPQDADGMTQLSGLLDPELRATIEAVWATWAAPGACNPDDDTPSVGQEHHDALTAMARLALASGELGQHNGLPATIIISTTLHDLESVAGQAVTGGGSLLPMADVIRLAAHAHHYLAIFDNHTSEPLYLGRTKRLASRGQRIVLHATDRGCTKPGHTEWIPPPHLDTGQARVNNYHHPQKYLSEDEAS